jgi:hypothetical protein
MLISEICFYIARGYSFQAVFFNTLLVWDVEIRTFGLEESIHALNQRIEFLIAYGCTWFLQLSPTEYAKGT